MSYKRIKYNFNIDPITKNIVKPKIFLCDRQLNKKGELYPVSTPRIKTNLNGADELSFTITKNVKNYTDNEIVQLEKKVPINIENTISNQYNQVNDYSVVFVQGFGYFEVLPTIVDNSNTIKNISGNSLGESELSQLHCTLECNTETDYKINGYTNPTIICNFNDTQRSLIHRILSYAPTYEVGEVDDTIAGLQRTFSFNNEDIISCFSKISEEINCIFDVVVTKNENGDIVRKVNIYDAQYCKTCNSRNIINGVCQNEINGAKCGSTDIGGIGEDTTILVSTENLSDEISLTPDGNMKNCLIIEGGDDMITDTVRGCLPSGNNKIYMFSDDTKSQWSQELRTKYEAYEKNLNENEEKYSELLELEYKIFDLILYLQSSRSPDIETAKRDLHEETEYVIEQYKTHFPKGLGMTEDNLNIAGRNGTVRQVFSLFVDEGYAIKYKNGSYNKETGYWTGDLILYQLKNNDANAIIKVGTDHSEIIYSDDEHPSTSSLTIRFHLDKPDYDTYIKQMIAITTKNYEYIENQGYNNPKDWQKYSLNQLYSYYCGYENCIQTLYELKDDTELENVKSTVEIFKENYEDRMDEINHYMDGLTDFIYYLYMYFGGYEYSSPAIPSAQDINYKEYTPKKFYTPKDAFTSMVHYIKYGTFENGSESDNTDTPIYCSNCNSTNVTLNGCNNCHRTDSIVTYGTLAQNVLDSYKSNQSNIETQRSVISEKFNLHNQLGDTLYKEFFSYIREDVYTNSNYVSDGLGNTEIINNTKELIQKAKQELAKCCVSQHTLSGDIHAFVAYSELNKDDFPIEGVYDKFILGNYMRYICDDKTYKLRLSSEEFIWNDDSCELNVEFTDVIRYLGGGISDIASLVQAVGSLATTANTAKTQSDKGVKISREFQKIKDEGLQSALSNVLSARNIDVQIDERGILLRKYDYDLDDWSPFQMRLINRNLVMTTDNWKTSSLAIGHMRYNGEELYGVVAGAVIGDLMITKELQVRNESGSVIIDENGITLDGGAIQWKKKLPSSSVDGLSDYLTQLDDRIQTFSQITDPSVDWTTTELKSKHAGDIWINPDNGLTKQWTGTKWVEITDSELKELAESKAQIFTSEPKAPYYVGDLWVQGKDGDIYNCIKNRISGNFDSSEWELSSKYTDDTEAKEALKQAQKGIKDAANAVGLANTAQSKADSAYTRAETAETNAKNYAVSQDTALSTTLTTAYQNYTKSKVKELDDSVSEYLGLGGTTMISDEYMISPYLGGGYLNIANGNKRVIIDPKNLGNTGYIFQVHNDSNIVMGIDDDGNASFAGTIHTNAGNIGGLNIEHNGLIARQYGYKIEIGCESVNNFGMFVGTNEEHLGGVGTYIGTIGIDVVGSKQGVDEEDGHTVIRADSIKTSEFIENGVSLSSKYATNSSIKNNYSQVQTGEITNITANGGWKNVKVYFDDPYRNTPLISILPASGFASENIYFVGFINDTTSYPGFEFSIYTPDTSFQYNVRWFAIGNLV